MVSVWNIARSLCSVIFSFTIPPDVDFPSSQSFVLSPSGNPLAAAMKQAVVWWDASGRSGTAKLPPAFDEDAFRGVDVLLSSDEKWIAAADAHRLALWSVGLDGRAREILSTALDSQRSSMAFSRQGNKRAV